ncbi:hypothetical protein GALL_46930 [mine drainage metagenome]|uniref:Carboxypeptidase-like regulatory domain-containing protein n=1 Tax=mine drainage metagenome TaxID=410659 RepID=A0A1J5T0F2_9ZZZZ
MDSISKQPLAGINVFLSNTSIGAISDEKGEFIIQQIPQGKFELIASSLNYETHVSIIQSAGKALSLTIQMKPSANILQEVVVESYDRNGWAKWGDYFKNNFIGAPSLSKDCKLLNPDILHFKLNSKTNTVRAFAHEKLIFENRALGYRISYLLIKFEFDITNNSFKYVGYPLFENLVPLNLDEQKKWESARTATYHGSLMHFMRSLYSNQLLEEGFEVKAMKKITGEERTRVKKLFKKMDEPARTLLNKDSLEYYNKVSKLSFTDDTVILSKLLPRDSIVFPVDESIEPGAVFFEFDDILHITYLHKKEPAAYTRLLLKRPDRDFISSDLSLPNKKGVSVFRNGNYFYGENIFTDGFWAWSEKLATMLPSDYWPAKKDETY